MMRNRGTLRIAAWWALFPFLFALGFLLAGGFGGTKPAPPPVVKTQQVPVTQVVEVTREVPATRVVPATVEVTRVVPVTVAAVATVVVTRVVPQAVPAVTAPPAGSAPAAQAPKFGESIKANGLTLTAKGPPYDWRGTTAYFTVENQTGATLNFNVPTSSFFIETSTGKRILGLGDPLQFNDLGSGKSKDFIVSFNVSWGDFQALKRDNAVAFYLVGSNGFNPRLPEARWREDLVH